MLDKEMFPMTKDEILKKSRTDNAAGDEREKAIQALAGDLAGIYALLLAVVIGIITTASNGPEFLNNALRAVTYCYLTVKYGVLAYHLKQKYQWFFCASFTIAAILEIYGFLSSFFGWG